MSVNIASPPSRQGCQNNSLSYSRSSIKTCRKRRLIFVHGLQRQGKKKKETWTKLHSFSLFLGKPLRLTGRRYIYGVGEQRGEHSDSNWIKGCLFSLLSRGLRPKWGNNTFLDVTRKGFREAINDKLHSGISEESSQKQVWWDQRGH